MCSIISPTFKSLSFERLKCRSTGAHKPGYLNSDIHHTFRSEHVHTHKCEWDKPACFRRCQWEVATKQQERQRQKKDFLCPLISLFPLYFLFSLFLLFLCILFGLKSTVCQRLLRTRSESPALRGLGCTLPTGSVGRLIRVVAAERSNEGLHSLVASRSTPTSLYTHFACVANNVYFIGHLAV